MWVFCFVRRVHRVWIVSRLNCLQLRRYFGHINLLSVKQWKSALPAWCIECCVTIHHPLWSPNLFLLDRRYSCHLWMLCSSVTLLQYRFRDEHFYSGGLHVCNNLLANWERKIQRRRMQKTNLTAFVLTHENILIIVPYIYCYWSEIALQLTREHSLSFVCHSTCHGLSDAPCSAVE